MIWVRGVLCSPFFDSFMVNWMQNEENLHKGHRQRLLKKYGENGISSIEEHEMLEILLFFAFSRCNTNEISHRLIHEFGSLKNVLYAPVDDILKVKGMGYTSAVLLRFLGDIVNYLNLPDNSSVRLSSIDKILEYCKENFTNSDREYCNFLMLDKRDFYIGCLDLTGRQFSTVNLDLKNILMTAFNVNASDTIIVHNHPHSSAKVSNSDIKNTRIIAQTLNALNIGLIDHVIIGTDGYYSMRSERLLEDIWK